MHLFVRRLRPGVIALVVTAVVALLGPLPALAAPLPGGTPSGTPQGSFTDPGSGPSVAGLEWLAGATYQVYIWANNPELCLSQADRNGGRDNITAVLALF